jgi:hypothetical protein
MSLTSPRVTTASPLWAMGRSITSAASSTTEGTFTEKRPLPVSMLPAGIRRLLRDRTLTSASEEMA